MKNTLSTNQITPGTQVNGGSATGGSQPPTNRNPPIAHIVVPATYSPSMNNRYGVEPYSTMKPATSSDSASTRSKGGRLVSASEGTEKITTIGNSGHTYQFRIVNLGKPIRLANPWLFCASTTAERLSEPAHSSTVMMTKPIETS